MSDWVDYFQENRRSLFRQCLRSRILIELIIKHAPPNGRILEAGAGTAQLSFILADMGFNVTAMDLSNDVLEYARARMASSHLPLSFVQGDILKLSSMFDDKYFSVVCHSGVMEHFGESDAVRGFSEQRKVSRKLIFSVPNNRVKDTSQLFGDERLLSNKNWLRLIGEAGYGKVTVFGDDDLPLITKLLFPHVLFTGPGSFWWKWLSQHSIFLCED